MRARYVSLLVWCKGGCQHQAETDLQKLVDAGRGDVPPTRLKFRCFNCSSDRTLSVEHRFGCNVSNGSTRAIGPCRDERL